MPACPLLCSITNNSTINRCINRSTNRCTLCTSNIIRPQELQTHPSAPTCNKGSNKAGVLRHRSGDGACGPRVLAGRWCLSVTVPRASPIGIRLSPTAPTRDLVLSCRAFSISAAHKDPAPFHSHSQPITPSPWTANHLKLAASFSLSLHITQNNNTYGLPVS